MAKTNDWSGGREQTTLRLRPELARRIRLAAAVAGKSQAALLDSILEREVPSLETLSRLVAKP